MDNFFYKLGDCIKKNDFSRIRSHVARRFARLGVAVRRWSRSRGKIVAVAPLDPCKPILSVYVFCDGSCSCADITIKALSNQTLKNFEVIVCTLSQHAIFDRFKQIAVQRADVCVRSEITDILLFWGKTQAAGKYVCCLHAGSVISPTYLEKALFLLETYCYGVVLASDGGSIVNERVALPGVASFFNITAAYEGAVGKKQVWSSIFSAYKALVWGYVRRFAFWRQVNQPGGLLSATSQRLVQGGSIDRPALLLCLGIITNGGGERLTSGVARYLNQQGWRIIVICTHDSGASESIPVQWFADFTPEVYLLHTFLADADDRTDFIRYLLQSRCVDVLLQVGSSHVYDLMPKLREVRPGLTVADLLFNTMGHTISNGKYAEFINNTIVENSEVKKYLLANGREQEKVTLITSGVSVPDVPIKDVSDLRKKLHIEEDATIFGYSGRLSAEKNPQAFVELACRCSDMPKVHFVMTGAGPLEAEIKNIIQRSNLKNFHYCGLVKNVFNYMALFDMLVLPSLFDGRPLAVMEAMHCGTPCIASSVGGIPELIEHGVAGVVVPTGNNDMFEKMIRYYASRPEEIQRLGKSAKEFAEQNLRMDSMLKRYESALSASFNKLYS